MTERLTVTTSNLTIEELEASKPKGYTKSEWVEELIRLVLKLKHKQPEFENEEEAISNKKGLKAKQSQSNYGPFGYADILTTLDYHQLPLNTFEEKVGVC